MTKGALKTGQGLNSNGMLLIEKGTCAVVENVFFILNKESVADVFVG